MTGRREVTVDFVWFTGTPGTQSAHGGTSPALIRVDHNSAPGASVGVIEEYAGGTGAQWRSTAWIAAFTASTLAEIPFLSTEFSVRTGGYVDGPSAGMLTTATFLALLRGDAVRPDVTMTGTINPDGTSGPVGGIPQKLVGAAEKGKHVFGYPLGCRLSEDLSDGKMIDLELLAASLGVQAVEIGNVRDAYRMLTGVELAEQVLASDDDVRITPEMVEMAKERIDVWRSSAQAGFARVQPILQTMTIGARAALSWVYAPIFKEFKAAQAYEQSGHLVAAEAKWIEVTVAIAAAEDELAIISAAQAGKLEDAFAVLSPYLGLQAQADALMNEVTASFSSKSSAVAAVNNVLAANSIIESLALLTAGKSGLTAAVTAINKLETAGSSSSAVVTEFVILLLKSAPILARAEASLGAARMDLAYASDEGGGSTVRVEKLPDLARAYASAAAAGRAYFQSLLSIDEASSAAFAFREPLWATASAGATIAANLAEQAAPAVQLLAVASGGHAYVSAAVLQNKYYALNYKDGAVGRPAALRAQMLAGRRAALAGIARVKATTGRVPSGVITEFNHGEQMSKGDDDDKIAALAAWWRATFAAELAAAISG